MIKYKLTLLVTLAALLGGFVYLDVRAVPGGPALAPSPEAGHESATSVAVAAAATTTAAATTAAAVTYPPLPDFAFETLTGRTLRSADLREETVLIHFWAGWCGVCFNEFPALIEAVRRQKGRAALVAIAIDDRRAASEAFLKRLEKHMGRDWDDALETPHIYWVWDEGKDISLDLFQTIRVPETIIVDQKRRMRSKIVGPVDWSVWEGGADLPRGSFAQEQGEG